ncbi:MAG TPA: hypothetical protein VHY20_15355 [Pirellulales bacterium]|jgi:hypothetical protein|nr:hypothetical protein [Pirellulales bacterium]
MDRTARRFGLLLLVITTGGLLLATISGCTSALAGIMYIVKGNDVDPEFTGLKNKRVAIVCRPVVELQYTTGSVHGEIAKQLGVLLKQNLGKIHIIDPQKVSEWTDEHEWTEYSEIGEALDADLVVGIDLEHFSIYQGQTLYQGKAQVALQVVDMKDDDKIAFQTHLPQLVYPPNTGVPTSEKPEDEFRRQFVRVLADRIGRYFYPHDGTQDFARDSESLN